MCRDKPKSPANEKEISYGRGVAASTLNLFRNRAVGFIDWLGLRK
jgi:hypothetical protein